MNATQLRTPPSVQVQRVVKEGDDKEADFLALRLLNKQGRVRLSEPLQLDSLSGKGILFATANQIGYFAAATRSASGAYSLVFSSLTSLRNAFASSETDGEIPFTPARTIAVNAPPNTITFASNETKLVVGLTSGSIAVYDVSSLTTPGDQDQPPSHVFSSPSGAAPRELAANPADLPDLVAVLYEPHTAGQRIDLLDLRSSQIVGSWISGATPDTIPTCFAWSPKGKQLAIGLQSGDIVSYSPSDTSNPKNTVARPTSLASHTVIAVTWLSNSDFHCIYVPAGEVTAESEQTHLLLSLDARANTITEVKLNAPYLPFPGLRPPGSFTAILRQWEPSKILIFVGDSTSSDIGLLGCVTDANGQESWTNLSLEETSTPSVPLDKDTNETVPMGLALDLTGSEEFAHKSPSGEDVVLPPPPVMYLYASDGTVVGWNILNTRAVPYPGMAKTAEAGVDSMETAVDSGPRPSVPSTGFVQAISAGPQVNQTSPVFGQANSSPFGQSAFGSLPAFGQKAPFSSTSAFGQPSPFGASTSTTATSQSTTGFGAFASSTPNKFGQTSTFGTSGLAPSSTTQTTKDLAPLSPMAMSVSNSEDPMSADTDTGGSAFGSLSLRGSGSASVSVPAKPSIFGSFTSQVPSNESKPAFGDVSSPGGSSSVIKPATGGFGSFASQGPATFGTSSFGSSASVSSDASKPASTAFGATGFGNPKPAPTSAFGQTGFGAFGSKSAFGQSAFGTTSFGSSSKPAPAVAAPVATPTSGGFASFAQSGTASFGSPARNTSGESKTEDNAAASTASSPSAFSSAANAFANSPLAFGASEPSTPKPSTAFVVPTTPDKSSSATSQSPASPFSSSSLAPATGAFAGLASHPTGFSKPEPGFGAFGVAVPSSSPFFNPPKAPTVGAFGGSVSAFSSSPSTPKASGEGSVKPTFGATSAIGVSTTPEKKSAFGSSSFGTPVFGQSSTPPVTPPTAATSAFSAFSGNKGFASFASGGSKSFGELLRDANDDKTPSKGSSSFASTPRVSVFGASGVAKAETGEGSASAARKPDSSEAREEVSSDDDDAEHGEAAEEDDDAISFLSQSFSSGSEDEEDGEQLEEVTPEPAIENESEENASEDESSTPGPEIRLTPSSPSKDTKVSSAKALETTTPPDSPDKQSSPIISSVPTTPIASPTPTPAGLGLGRPSTRPSRSSPLANAPISGDDDDDEPTIKPAGSTGAKSSELPNKLPPQEEGGAVAAPIAPKKESASDTAPSRTKTPPLLSAFGPPMPKPSPFVLTPSSSTAPTTAPQSTTANAGGFLGTKPAIGSNTATFSSASGSLFTMFPSAPLARPAMTSASSAPATSTASKVAPAIPTAITTPQSTPSSPSFNPPPAGFFGQKPAAPASTLSFGQKAPGPAFGFPPPAPATASGPKTPPPPSTTPSSSLPFPLNKPGPSASSPPGFGSLTGGPFGKPVSPQPAATPDPLAQIEEGMQKESINLVHTIAGEFETLKQLSIQADKRKGDHYKSLNVSRKASDLGDKTKFGIADAKEFGRLLRSLNKEVTELKELRTAHTKAIRELEAAMLKVSMRKEEVVRFSKAKDDAEFAKILKARSLGPEHLETQIQLRRGVRVIRDRIQKLEDHLHLSKKRLNQLKLGKPGLRAPSLDTINRTYRNIDIAITQQADDVDRLVGRVSKMNLSSTQLAVRKSSPFPSELRDSSGNRAVAVTPNVAATTAAALNAERAAQRLKGALLRVRKEPQLNTQAVGTAAPALDFRTPQKLATAPELSENSVFKLAWNPPPASSPLGLGSLPQTPTPKWSPSAYERPESPGSPTPTPAHSTSLRQRGGAGSKLHAKPIAIKRSPAPASTTATPPSGFSWGPLPGVTPMKTLSADVRKAGDSPPALSSSWVAEGFGTKK